MRLKLRAVSVPSFVTVDSELFNDSRGTDNRKTRKEAKVSRKKMES